MIFRLSTVTPAGEIPLLFTVAEAKAHIGVEHGEHDALITAMIRAAQGAVEAFTGLLLTSRQMRLTGPAFPALPAGLMLRTGPVSAVASVAHLDEDGEQVTLAEADWRWSEFEPETIYPAIGGEWPSLAAGLGEAAVRVTFTAGYEEGLCPPDLSAAVKLTCAKFYADREGGGDGAMPPGAVALASPHRRILI